MFDTFFSLIFNKNDKLLNTKSSLTFLIHIFYLSTFKIIVCNGQRILISSLSNRCNKAYKINIQFLNDIFRRMLNFI